MTTTILAVIALTGSMAPGAKPEFQAQTDYGQALKLAASEKKPMAVLIAKGDAFAKLMTDGGLSAEAKKVLAEKYVCVSVNVETESGKALAGQFQLTDGLVISSAGGTHQAFRQSGTVSAADLAKQTATYANVTATPSTTVTAGTPVYVAPATYAAPTYYYPSHSTCPGGNCPNAGYVYPSTYGSSCPNGRCPNAGPVYIR
jgi:hypothetical protein